jgi:hypothetical protein
MRRRARESRDRRNRHPHFDSRIRATRCSCTAPCKEQAGNREPSSAPIFYTRTLLLRSDQPRRLRWVRFAKCAARAFAPSPLAGEGTIVFPRTRMGEGFLAITHPSPIIATVSRVPFVTPIHLSNSQSSSFPRRNFCAQAFASLLRQAPIEGGGAPRNVRVQRHPLGLQMTPQARRLARRLASHSASRRA